MVYSKNAAGLKKGRPAGDTAPAKAPLPGYSTVNIKRRFLTNSKSALASNTTLYYIFY